MAVAEGEVVRGWLAERVVVGAGAVEIGVVEVGKGPQFWYLPWRRDSKVFFLDLLQLMYYITKGWSSPLLTPATIQDFLQANSANNKKE